MDSLEQVIIRRKELFEVWRRESDVSKRHEHVSAYIFSRFSVDNSNDDLRRSIMEKSRVFCADLKKRWRKSRYFEPTFLKNNRAWLNCNFNLSAGDSAWLSTGPSTSSSINTTTRKMKAFEECSEKTKRRRVQKLVETTSCTELAFATRLSLNVSGKRDAAHLVQEAALSSPKRATKIKKLYKSPKTEPIKMSADQALASYVDKKMTKYQYIYTRKETKRHNADIYPSYKKLLLAKQACYPEEIVFTKISAEVKVQSLVDHTIKRLADVLYETLTNMKIGIETQPSLNIFFKWGCDGASGYSQYKQTFSEEASDDAFLFVISLVPLKVTTTALADTRKAADEITIWENPSPSSTRYCRPLKILFKKESEGLVRQEVNKIQNQITELVATKIEVEGNEIFVHQTLLLTMVDGKICSYLTEQSSQNCYVCGATPKQMNDLGRHIQRPVTVHTSYAFGISPLHARIRFLECILHISYRLEIKKWQIRKENKEVVELRKKLIQEKLRKEMGLLVDIPKPGCGTTNDGNTSRRFFANPSLAASITGVNEELIRRFDVILKTIACSKYVDIEEFRKYTLSTAQLYIKEYNWYYMPASLHKIFFHGADIIQHYCILPIGALSEEAQEARNKDCKRFREHHARKFSRIQTIEDLFHMFLITSDPLISSYRIFSSPSPKELPQEVIALLQVPAIEQDEEQDDNEDDDSEYDTDSEDSD